MSVAILLIVVVGLVWLTGPYDSPLQRSKDDALRGSMQ